MQFIPMYGIEKQPLAMPFQQIMWSKICKCRFFSHQMFFPMIIFPFLFSRCNRIHRYATLLSCYFDGKCDQINFIFLHFFVLKQCAQQSNSLTGYKPQYHIVLHRIPRKHCSCFFWLCAPFFFVRFLSGQNTVTIKSARASAYLALLIRNFWREKKWSQISFEYLFFAFVGSALLSIPAKRLCYFDSIIVLPQ